MVIFNRPKFRSGSVVAKGQERTIKGRKVRKEYRFRPSDQGKAFEFGNDEVYLLEHYPLLFHKK